MNTLKNLSQAGNCLELERLFEIAENANFARNSEKLHEFALLADEQGGEYLNQLDFIPNLAKNKKKKDIEFDKCTEVYQRNYLRKSISMFEEIDSSEYKLLSYIATEGKSNSNSLDISIDYLSLDYTINKSPIFSVEELINKENQIYRNSASILSLINELADIAQNINTRTKDFKFSFDLEKDGFRLKVEIPEAV